jgi:hypothetical protein
MFLSLFFWFYLSALCSHAAYLWTERHIPLAPPARKAAGRMRFFLLVGTLSRLFLTRGTHLMAHEGCSQYY